MLKKDSRWELIEGNLEKPERERLFDDHIDHLIGKDRQYQIWIVVTIFLFFRAVSL